MTNWIDVTQSMQPGMVNWPKQNSPEFKLLSSMEKGDMANVTQMKLSVHTGTHMDAPLHFVDKQADISQMPIEAMTGTTRVMAITSGGNISKEDVQMAEERSGSLQQGDKVLFRTPFSEKKWLMEEFDISYPALTAEAARYLVSKKILLTGIDYLSIAPYDNLVEVHEILLENNIWIIEGLDLSQIKEGNYEIVALPLKIKGADGSPCRVLLRQIL